MILLGTIVGFASAGCTAISYVSSRRFMTLSSRGSGQLTAMSFTLMGLASAAILPCFAGAVWPPYQTLILPLLVACGFFLIAQVTSFYVLTFVQASRLSPLLGMKVVTIAILTPVFLGTHISPMQWAAVVLSTVAAFLLIHIGGKLAWQATTGVATMVVCYSLSDIGIVKLVNALAGNGAMAAMIAVVLIYMMAGVFGVGCLIAYGIPDRGTWKLAMPYTVSWFISALLYFISLQFLGVVFAIIIQATRGLQSIALGVFLSHHGFHYLEEKTDRATLIRRIAAAILMLMAIVLYFVSAK